LLSRHLQTDKPTRQSTKYYWEALSISFNILVSNCVPFDTYHFGTPFGISAAFQNAIDILLASRWPLAEWQLAAGRWQLAA
jgi:hypothetical protein